METGEMIYEGKAKRIYQDPKDASQLLQEFKNSLTAFNGVKRGEFSSKGELNCQISSLIFKFLSERGVKHHFVASPAVNWMVTKKLTMIPLEVVVRNVAAGSLAKRLGWEEGTKLPEPVVELYYKSDSLGDPIINDDHAMALKTVASRHDLDVLRELGKKINLTLREFFEKCGLQLVDFKLEFGRLPNGEIVLGDEVTPDTCRLWDMKTQEKMDKDRFRRDLGNVEEAYQNVWTRIKTNWGTV